MVFRTKTKFGGNNMNNNTITQITETGGYVRLVDSMGSDLTIVNSARVSYDKQSDEMTEKDGKLIKYLGSHDHTSPFRHATLQFEVLTPLMIARQWYKYVVGSTWNDPLLAWNESSRRYVTEDESFYIPTEENWRSKPANSKQGSGIKVDKEAGEFLTQELTEIVAHGEEMYRKAMDMGIAPEQARLFLPAYSMNVRFYWTASLQGVAHLINQRSKQDAQYEFRLFAKAVYDLAKEKFPIALDTLIDPEILKELNK
jgi:thymidylate synthase (FAD)